MRAQLNTSQGSHRRNLSQVITPQYIVGRLKTGDPNSIAGTGLGGTGRMKIRQSIISDNTIATTADNTLAKSMISKKPRREIRDISTHGSFDPKYARLKSQGGA